MKLYKIFVIQLCLDFFQNIHGTDATINEMYITDKNGNNIDINKTYTDNELKEINTEEIKICGKLNNSCIKKIHENLKFSKKIIFETIDTSDVTDLSHMFDGFEQLEHVLGFKNFNTSNVTNMSFMFNKCINLKFVIFPLNTSEVTDMSYIFNDCENLEMIAFYPKTNTEKVTNMSHMFNWCKKLRKFNLKNLNTVNVTNISHMFSGCTQITLDSFNTLKFKNSINMSNAFDDIRGVNDIEKDFLNTNEFPKKIVVKTNDIENKEILNIIKLYANLVEEIVFENTEETTRLNCKKLFENCKKLKKVTFNCNNILCAEDMSSMFSGCENLENINGLNSFNTVQVKNMSYLFNDCKNLKTLDSEKTCCLSFKTPKVNNMSHMFCNCKELANLDLAFLSTSNVTDMSYMFSGCENLQKINIGNFTTPIVTDMSYMFNGCKKLQKINMENSTSKNISNMSYMFNGCNQIINSKCDFFYFINWKNIKGVNAIEKLLGEQNHFLNFDIKNVNTDYNDIILYLYDNYTNQKILTLKKCILNKEYIEKLKYDFKELEELTLVNVKFENKEDIINFFKKFINLKTLILDNVELKNKELLESFATSCENLKNLKNLILLNFKMYFDYESEDNKNTQKENSKNDKQSKNNENKTCSYKYLYNKIFKNIETLQLNNVEFLYVCDKDKSSSNDNKNNNINDYVIDQNKPISLKKLFTLCKKLKSIEFGHITSPNIYDMSYMFSCCEKLETISSLTNLGTHNVEYLQYMFSGCKELKSLIFHGSKKIKDASYMFNDCESLETIKLFNFNTSYKEKNVQCETKTENMFKNCKNLNNFTFDETFNINKENTIKHLFGNIEYNNKQITINNRYIVDFPKIKEALCNLNNFKIAQENKMIEEKIKNSQKEAEKKREDEKRKQEEEDNKRNDEINKKKREESKKELFEDLNKISDVNIVSISTDSGIEINRKDISFEDFKKDYLQIFKNKKTLNVNNLIIYDTEMTENELKDFECFIKKASFIELVNVNFSEKFPLRKLFTNNGNLVEVSFKNVDITNISDMSEMFKGCVSLSEIKGFENLDTGNVGNLESIFDGCESLSKINLTKLTITENTNIKNMFNGCNSIIINIFFKYPGFTNYIIKNYKNFDEDTFKNYENFTKEISSKYENFDDYMMTFKKNSFMSNSLFEKTFIELLKEYIKIKEEQNITEENVKAVKLEMNKKILEFEKNNTTKYENNED